MWRETIVEAKEGGLQVRRPEILQGFLRPCGLVCLGWGNGYGLWVTPFTKDELRPLPGGRWRVEARRELEELPTRDPSAIEIRWFVP